MSRAPFVPIGSLTAWTSTSWPREIRSWMRRPVALALELGDDDLVDVQEAVLLEADVDERRLHPGQDVVDDALVDVAGDRAASRPLEVDLDDLPVLEHRDALLADVDRDEHLLAHGRKRRPPRCLAPPPALRPSAFAAAGFLAGRSLRRPRACPSLLRRRRSASAPPRRAPLPRRLLALLPSAAPRPATARLGGFRSAVSRRRQVDSEVLRLQIPTRPGRAPVSAACASRETCGETTMRTQSSYCAVAREKETVARQCDPPADGDFSSS